MLAWAIIAAISLGNIGADDAAVALRGIRRIRVAAERLPPALDGARLTPDLLIADVQGHLSRNGLALDARAPDAVIRVALNAVNIETTSGRKRGIAYNLSLTVEQEATVTAGS